MTERSTDDLGEIYGLRFSEADAQEKDLIWREVTRFLQRFVAPDAAILDIACDRGDFIRNVVGGERWASDLRDVRGELPEEIRFVQANGLELDRVLPNRHFDVAFSATTSSTCQRASDVIEQFRVAHRLLKPGGSVIVLQPNIRLVGARYWDFIDHSVALTEQSLTEAAELAGFRAETVIKKAQWLRRPRASAQHDRRAPLGKRRRICFRTDIMAHAVYDPRHRGGLNSAIVVAFFLVVALAALCGAVVVAAPGPPPLRRRSSGRVGPRGGTASRRPSVGRAGRRGRLDAATLCAVAGGTTHVDPYATNTVSAGDLTGQQLPVVQAYAAWTPRLERANAEALAVAGAPERILLERVDRLDGSTQELESRSVFLAFLCRYRELRATPQWQVLARPSERCGEPRRIASIEAREGDAARVPPPPRSGDVVYARFFLTRSAADMLTSLLYKPSPPAEILLDEEQRRRFLRTTAARPHVVRVPAAAGFFPRFGGDISYETLRLYHVRSLFRVEFFSVPRRSAP